MFKVCYKLNSFSEILCESNEFEISEDIISNDNLKLGVIMPSKVR